VACLALALVSGLLEVGRPSAIVRLVVTIIVDAVKRQARWSCSHISIEVLETVDPSFTNADTSTAIILVRLMVSVVASTFHADPSPVLFWEVAVQILVSHT
jgi:hypothetical protein